MNTTMEQFAEAIRKEIKSRVSDICDVQIKNTVKNNSLNLTGIAIFEEGCEVTPVIYLNSYFDEHSDFGRDIASICNDILEAYYAARNENLIFDAAVVTDFNKAKEFVCCKLINAELNRTLLTKVPHKPFLDLELILYVPIFEEETHVGNVTVNKEIAKSWECNEEDLFEIAIRNTQRLFRGNVCPVLSRKLTEVEAFDFYDLEVDKNSVAELHMCTNSEANNGAVVVFYENILKRFAEKINNDFYILPCSIHEVLFFPDFEGLNAYELQNIVKDINGSDVIEEDVFLSNNVYRYYRNCGEIRIA